MELLILLISILCLTLESKLIPCCKIMYHTETDAGGHGQIFGFIGDYLIIMVNWLGVNGKCQKIMLTLR